jgi:hypothetical protein
LRVKTRAGHGAGKPHWMQIDHFADERVFAARFIGVGEGTSPQGTMPGR